MTIPVEDDCACDKIKAKFDDMDAKFAMMELKFKAKADYFAARIADIELAEQ